MSSFGVFGRYLIVALSLVAGAAPAAVDPTRPPVTVGYQQGATQSGAADLRLQAVRALNGRRIAVINGRTVAEGEQIGGGRVTRIGTSTVTLTRGGKTERLVMGLPLTKQWKKSKQD